MKKTDNTENLQHMLFKLWGHIGTRRQKQFGLLLILSIISAFVEIISLGSVIPFLGVLVSPEKVFAYPSVANISVILGLEKAEQLVLPLTILFCVAALFAGGFRMLLLWLSTRLSYASGAELSLQMYRRTLYQPYQVHVSRNSSEVIAGISNKVSAAINFLYQSITLVSSFILIVTIIGALFLVDPHVAMISLIAFGSGYGIITWLSRYILKSNSCHIAKESNFVIKALQEGLGSIRDVLLDGTQEFYSKIYGQSDFLLRRAQGNNTFISISPRYIMEVFGMIIIAVLAYSLSNQSEGLVYMLPVLGALALGAQRLLPAFQQMYTAWARMIGNKKALGDVLSLLEQPLPKETGQSNSLSIKFNRIVFNDVYFRYFKSEEWVLNNINLCINKGERIGLVGATGSGKSTVLDILMGLLPPSKGKLLLDGIPLTNSSIGSWQKTISHVPQSIYLTDSSIAENIAFGISSAEIDLEKVKFAAEQANVAEFIESKPDGYQSLVGERGVRLSGGQRQRIGIARALYKNATVLIFDEATSALDNATEKAIMDAIDTLSRDLTIIIIAHRLTTVQDCDVIFELKKGEVVAKGKYEELLECSPSFRKMTNNININLKHVDNRKSTF